MSKQILFKVLPYIISTIFVLNISDRAISADFNNLALSDTKKDQILFLDTTVNTVFKGRLIVVWRGEDILVKYVDLKLMGLVNDRGQQSIVEGETYVSLKSLAPDLDFKVNDINLTLQINARTNLLTNRTVKSFSDNTPPADLIQAKDNSLFLNYAVNVNAAQNQRTDATIFTELGYSFDKSLLYSGFRYNGINGFQRGFSNLTIDDPNNLNRTIVGDSFVNNSSNLGGNPTIGGLSFGRKFALNPYLVTSYQDFSLRGAVTTPSTVDIYNNGVFLRREQLSPGQYELRNLPLNTGNNNTTAIVRDSFGREQVINNLNYFSANILKPGLTDYNFNVGFRRQENNSNPNYQELLAVGNYRAGINEQVTAGLRAEGSNNLVNFGADLALKFPFGEIGIEGAVSNSNGASGTAGTLKYNYSTPSFGFNASTKILSPNYANTTLDSKQDRTNWDNNLQVVFPISSHNSLNLQYQNMQYRDLGTFNRISASTAFNLSPQHNLSLTLSHNNQSNGRTDNTVFVGFSAFDDRNNSISSINYQNQSNQNSIIAQIDKPLGASDGLGYRLQTRLADGQPLSTNATLRGQTSFGRYEVNYSRAGQDNSAYLNAAGGVLLIKNKTFFTRPLDNSYSLVEVPGMPNVSIRLNNNIVGKTGNDGSLILTGLQPYYASKIGVERKDIPLDYSVGSSDKFVAPMERSGVVVTFPVRKLQSYLGKVLVRTLQKPVIPSYGQITVETNDGTVKSPLGTEAEFYLENLTTGKHSALIEYEGGECRFTIDIPKKDGLIVELGELTCANADVSTNK
jgi:outer membrane usher protein